MPVAHTGVAHPEQRARGGRSRFGAHGLHEGIRCRASARPGWPRRWRPRRPGRRCAARPAPAGVAPDRTLSSRSVAPAGLLHWAQVTGAAEGGDQLERPVPGKQRCRYRGPPACAPPHRSRCAAPGAAQGTGVAQDRGQHRRDRLQAVGGAPRSSGRCCRLRRPPPQRPRAPTPTARNSSVHLHRAMAGAVRAGALGIALNRPAAIGRGAGSDGTETERIGDGTVAEVDRAALAVPQQPVTRGRTTAVVHRYRLAGSQR